MQNPPREIIILYYGTILFWILLVGAIWFLGQRGGKASDFRARMWEQRYPALVITVVYFLSVFLSGRGINPYTIAIFCQAWIGLALAQGIPDFEPVPLIRSHLRREHIAKTFLPFILFSIAAGVIGIFFGAAAMSLGQSLFHETALTDEIMQAFPTNKFQAFFMFLAGGGIAEELVHRLVMLSLLWALTKRPGLAILVSAVVHSAYHFTPVNLLYLSFREFPMSQFISGVLMGIIWGYVFIKRGFETAAIGHTLSDWLPMLLFM